MTRNVSIAPYDLPGEWGFVSGIGPSTLLFADNPNWYFDIRAGAMSDSFVMSGDPLASKVYIDGGAGDDILIGSGGNWLSGGAGRDLLIAGGLASVLDGGLDEDILIGGSLNNTDKENIDAIREIWSGGADYSTRVAILRADLLADDRITGNGSYDSITGGLDSLDLFFGESSEVFDYQDGEELVPLF